MYVCHNYNLEVIKTTIVRVSARQVASEAIIKLNLESVVFNYPFEITRTRWNLSAHENNQSYYGKISKAVPAMFQIHPT